MYVLWVLDDLPLPPLLPSVSVLLPLLPQRCSLARLPVRLPATLCPRIAITQCHRLCVPVGPSSAALSWPVGCRIWHTVRCIITSSSSSRSPLQVHRHRRSTLLRRSQSIHRRRVRRVLTVTGHTVTTTPPTRITTIRPNRIRALSVITSKCRFSRSISHCAPTLRPKLFLVRRSGGDDRSVQSVRICEYAHVRRWWWRWR